MFKVYKSYSFIDKDPVIGIVGDAIKESRKTWKDIPRNGGPKLATLRNWFLGETRRPQFTTVRAALRAVGYDFPKPKAGLERVNYHSSRDLEDYWPTKKRKTAKKKKNGKRR